MFEPLFTRARAATIASTEDIPMTRSSRAAIAVVVAGLLASCMSESAESSSTTRACAPETFSCDGYTPGFWSNKNGCAQLTDAVVTELNAFLQTLTTPTCGVLPGPVGADQCGEVAALVKADSECKADKLIAMFVAFWLNNDVYWDGDCFGGPIHFEFNPKAWDPGDCDSTFEFTGQVTFAELIALVQKAYAEGTSCEQETLKNFLDAANNDARVCLCDCPTGATGATGGYGE
jgi:hypothetical protein